MKSRRTSYVLKVLKGRGGLKNKRIHDRGKTSNTLSGNETMVQTLEEGVLQLSDNSFMTSF